MNSEVSSIVWLRRDLRLYDNISLSSAMNELGLVQPIFIFDTDILSHFPNHDDKRVSFIADILCDIDKQLKEKSGNLLIFYGSAREIIPKIAVALKVKKIFAGIDYEPFGQERDLEIINELKPYGIDLVLQNDHLLISPTEVLKSDGNPYKIFTPYSRIWRKTLQERHLQYHNLIDEGRYSEAKLNLEIKPLNLDKGVEYLLEQIGYRYSPSSDWKINGSISRLDNFVDSHIQDYPIRRDFVGIEGTSKLSPYIRFGVISIRECYKRALETKNYGCWINELIWRDFYAAILYHFPETVTQEFLPAYKSLKWIDNQEYLMKWQQGLTGYPIVDAAMRQLKQEGWMHNRARMIVASFFTKDLLLDWRLGERYFSQHLMDYELSSNVGGWQWAASVGTDAQPYFRIFNPTTQSKRFDPDGVYIKKYIPELRDVPIKYIHEPVKYKSFLSYPEPLVIHDVMRKKALALFSEARRKFNI